MLQAYPNQLNDLIVIEGLVLALEQDYELIRSNQISGHISGMGSLWVLVWELALGGNDILFNDIYTHKSRVDSIMIPPAALIVTGL